MRQLIVLSAAFLLATSCNGQPNSACETDAFFCGPQEGWEREASRLPTKRVMELQAINWNHHRPPSDSFIRVLGSRGEESVRELIRHLMSDPRHRTPYFYRPILSEVKLSGRFDICGTPYYSQLESILTRADGPRASRQRAKQDLAKYCADPLGAPWTD